MLLLGLGIPYRLLFARVPVCITMPAGICLLELAFNADIHLSNALLYFC